MMGSWLKKDFAVSHSLNIKQLTNTVHFCSSYAIVSLAFETVVIGIKQNYTKQNNTKIGQEKCFYSKAH